MANASSPPARATITHRAGAAASPNSENGVVKKIGSGFHDGPSVVTRSRWAISRPQMIHAHGSYVGVEGVSNDSAASARHASTSSRHGRTSPSGSPAGGPTAGGPGAVVVEVTLAPSLPT